MFYVIWHWSQRVGRPDDSVVWHLCWSGLLSQGTDNALKRPGDLEEGYSFQSDQCENSSGEGCARKTQKPRDTQRSSAATWRASFSTKLSSSCWIWASLIHWQCPYGWEQSTPVFSPGGFHGQMEPGRLRSMGSQRVSYDWNDLAHMQRP